jgi:tRNA pseudouridine38-40 synthase
MANAQKDAIARTYSYYFHLEKQVFLTDSSFYYAGSPLNFDLLNKSLAFIATQSDFSILCKRPDQYKNTDCLISNTELVQINEFQWVIRITANRFLQGMMRLIIGNLFEIANGKRSLDELKTCFKQNIRPEYYTSAYPQGLHLSKVEYPYLKRISGTQLLN